MSAVPTRIMALVTLTGAWSGLLPHPARGAVGGPGAVSVEVALEVRQEDSVRTIYVASTAGRASEVTLAGGGRKLRLTPVLMGERNVRIEFVLGSDASGAFMPEASPVVFMGLGERAEVAQKDETGKAINIAVRAWKNARDFGLAAKPDACAITMPDAVALSALSNVVSNCAWTNVSLDSGARSKKISFSKGDATPDQILAQFRSALEAHGVQSSDAEDALKLKVSN